jgi:branched-chain amino acid aminotransferase/4-amino-4-deoxychorismate lyase
MSVSKLPDILDLQELVKQSGLADVSARLRLTLTGGSSTEPCRLWVTANPLGIVKTDGLTLADDFWPVDARDPLIRFKSLNYWLRRRAFEEAQAAGADEKLSQDASGPLWEGSRTSLLIVKNQSLIGPPEGGPRLYSIANKALSDFGAEISFQKITTQILVDADEVLLMNALRGILTVGQWRDHSIASPGPVASSLRALWQATYF